MDEDGSKGNSLLQFCGRPLLSDCYFIFSSQVKLVSDTEKDDDSFIFEKLDPESQRLCKLVCLSICYAANCGGIGTLTGTGPNLVLKGNLDL